MVVAGKPKGKQSCEGLEVKERHCCKEQGLPLFRRQPLSIWQDFLCILPRDGCRVAHSPPSPRGPQFLRVLLSTPKVAPLHGDWATQGFRDSFSSASLGIPPKGLPGGSAGAEANFQRDRPPNTNVPMLARQVRGSEAYMSSPPEWAEQ